PGLIWWNFAHLFAISLVPVSTAWVAVTRFAAVPVAVYAAVFVMVNSAYVAFVSRWQKKPVSRPIELESPAASVPTPSFALPPALTPPRQTRRTRSSPSQTLRHRQPQELRQSG